MFKHTHFLTDQYSLVCTERVVVRVSFLFLTKDQFASQLELGGKVLSREK